MNETLTVFMISEIERLKEEGKARITSVFLSGTAYLP